MWTVKVFISLTIGIYVLCAALLFLLQRAFLYAPTAEYSHSFETVELPVEGFVNKSIVLNKNNKNAILYFGGNGESIVHSAADLEHAFPDHALYLNNYRGYGGSGGKASEKALYHDALALYEHVENKHGDISIIGRSLGTGVATYLASIRNVSSLSLVTPYDSIERLAQDKFPFFPISILLKDKYNSVDRAMKIEAPVLMILAEKDEVIPYRNSKSLISAFPKEQVITEVILGAGHNNLSESARYFSLLSDFTSSH